MRHKTTLTINITGTEGHNWPHLTININDVIYYDDIVIGNKILSFDLADADVYNVSIRGINKLSGKNNIRDTIFDENGKILKDKSIIVNDISINSISMGDPWVRSQSFNAGTFTFGGFYENGELSFIIENPVLDWIITEKYIKDQITNNTEMYDGSDKFDHKNILNKINHIESQYFR